MDLFRCRTIDRANLLGDQFGLSPNCRRQRLCSTIGMGLPVLLQETSSESDRCWVRRAAQLEQRPTSPASAAPPVVESQVLVPAQSVSEVQLRGHAILAHL